MSGESAKFHSYSYKKQHPQKETRKHSSISEAPWEVSRLRMMLVTGLLTSLHTYLKHEMQSLWGAPKLGREQRLGEDVAHGGR